MGVIESVFQLPYQVREKLCWNDNDYKAVDGARATWVGIDNIDGGVKDMRKTEENEVYIAGSMFYLVLMGHVCYQFTRMRLDIKLIRVGQSFGP